MENLALRLLDCFGGCVSDEEESVLIDQVKKMDPSLNDRQASVVVQIAQSFEQQP